MDKKENVEHLMFIANLMNNLIDTAIKSAESEGISIAESEDAAEFIEELKELKEAIDGVDESIEGKEELSKLYEKIINKLK